MARPVTLTQADGEASAKATTALPSGTSPPENAEAGQSRTVSHRIECQTDTPLTTASPPGSAVRAERAISTHSSRPMVPLHWSVWSAASIAAGSRYGDGSSMAHAGVGVGAGSASEEGPGRAGEGAMATAVGSRTGGGAGGGGGSGFASAMPTRTTEMTIGMAIGHSPNRVRTGSGRISKAMSEAWERAPGSAIAEIARPLPVRASRSPEAPVRSPSCEGPPSDVGAPARCRRAPGAHR